MVTIIRIFRKNPAHYEEFSHEDESDGEEKEEGDGPECPFGTSCYRKNPAHRRQFKHTRPPAPAGSKRVRTSTRTSESHVEKRLIVFSSCHNS